VEKNQVMISTAGEFFCDDISVDVYIKKNTLIFPFIVKFPDRKFSHIIEVRYNFNLDLNTDQLNLIKIGITIFLGQLFICKKITITDAIDNKLLSHCNSLLRLLYNNRNYIEGTAVIPPTIHIKNDMPIKKIKKQRFISSRQKKAINLISGGKDSTSAAMLLEQNGFNVINCFISGFNLQTGKSEIEACKRLFGTFYIIKVKGFEEIIDESVRISYPNGNKKLIIAGRDLLSALFVIPLALKKQANYITVGNERDVWKNNIDGITGKIPIHDTQSELVVIELNKIIKTVIPGIHLFSPIAGLHEIYILSWLYKNKPEVISGMSSCFNGKWCGECWKCARYFLIQKFIGSDLIKFQNNPLKPMHWQLKKYFKSHVPLGFQYSMEIVFLLKYLRVHDVDFSYKNIGYDHDPHELFQVHSACLIPPGFRRKLL
jgi:7-cyano-7-deazaguanine synthase in queuosine biosynthesis